MTIPERWLNVVSFGEAGREILRTFCLEINPKETEAEFFYVDKPSEIEGIRKRGDFCTDNIYSLQEFEKIIKNSPFKDKAGTVFIADLGDFKTGANALVKFGKEITSYYRSKPNTYEQTSIALVSLPFEFEGKEIREKALEALEEAKNSVDLTIVVDYNRIPHEGLSSREAFERAKMLLSKILKAMILPFTPGWQFICVEWTDFLFLFKCSTEKMVCVGVGESKKSGIEALESALDNILYDTNIDIGEAEAAFLSISMGEDLPFSELEKVISFFKGKTINEYAYMLFGAYINPKPDIWECIIFAPVKS